MKKMNLFHSVFFELKDASENAVENFIAECRTYLEGQPGILFFRLGRIAEDHARPVNMRDFHVSLHIIFESKKHHDDYQSSEKHNIFVDRNSGNWGTVRVYDAYIR